METELKKQNVAKFPLRLMPSVRSTAEAYSRKEGVSLNQFINVAVAEKLAILRQEEWEQNRKKPSEGLLAEARELLNRNRNRPVELGDELPEGYLPRQDFKSRKNG
jgi:hypothetical protein